MMITLLAASLIIFFVLEILPGDPAALMLGLHAEPEALAALRAELGLDRPMMMRYGNWLSELVRGDLGTSYTYDVPVSELIWERIYLSFPLAILAIVLSTLIAIPLGIIAASNHSKPTDLIIMAFSQLGIAIPNFWFALLLIILFSVSLRISAGRRVCRMGCRRDSRPKVPPAADYRLGPSSIRNFNPGDPIFSFRSIERRLYPNRSSQGK